MHKNTPTSAFAYILSIIIILVFSFTPTLAQNKSDEEKADSTSITNNRSKDEKTATPKKITGPTLYSTIRNLAKTERLNVIFDQQSAHLAEIVSIDPTQIADLAPLRAIAILLNTNGLTYSQVDRRTIAVSTRKNSFHPYVTLEEIIRKANKYDQVIKTARLAQKIFKLHDYDFKDATLDTIIRTIADQEKLNVIYEDNIAKLIETKKSNFTLKGVSAPTALTVLLNSQRLVYVPSGERTIILRTAAFANYDYGAPLENMIIIAEENQALGIE